MNTHSDPPPGAPPQAGEAAPALPPGAELRRAPRFTLLVRTAKLVADGREFICVLRDISATGAKVRLFHAIPPHTELALETGSGERYPMDVVWARDDHAGFRFHQEIDVQHLIDDRRGQYPKRQIRVRSDQPALVHAGGRMVGVKLCDISQQGACIECAEHFMLRQLIRLEIPGFPEIFAKVRWRQQPRYGLVFENGFTLEELAGCVMRLNAQVPGRAVDAPHLPLRRQEG